MWDSPTEGDAIMTKTKSRRWTVAEIARANEATGGTYFDRQTLKFFGQRRGDFSVYHSKTGRVFVFADASRGWNSTGLSSFAEFHPGTGRTSGVRHDDVWHNWTRDEAEAFVKSLRDA
jgi:hypothetical protein